MDYFEIPADYGVRRGLLLQAEAAELVALGASPEGREIRLAPQAAAAWTRMREAAEAAGITLAAYSGFRSIARQKDIIRAKLASGQSLEAILAIVAAPGYSEHHTGRAVDIGVPGVPALTEDFALTAAFAWLSVHAAGFGFHLSYPRGNPHGIAYEPWHWFFYENTA